MTPQEFYDDFIRELINEGYHKKADYWDRQTAQQVVFCLVINLYETVFSANIYINIEEMIDNFGNLTANYLGIRSKSLSGIFYKILKRAVFHETKASNKELLEQIYDIKRRLHDKQFNKD